MLADRCDETVCFGPFEVNPRSGELRKHGIRIKLQDLPFRLLLVLLEHPGEVVTREELQARLWPAGTHVDFERGLGTALNKVREALGDSGANPRFIETIPRRGYRFVAEIEKNVDPPPAVIPQPLRRWWKYAVALGVAAALAAGAVASLRHRQPLLTDKDTLVMADFTNSTGDPVFDGTLRDALAFQIEQSPFLKVLDDEVVRQDLELMRRSPQDRITNELAHDICLREGDKAMLNGSIVGLGKSYVIELKAVNCQTGVTLARQQAEATDKEHALQALARAAQGIRGKLGESLASIQKLAPPDFPVTTGSVEAYQAFTTGWHLFFESRFVESIPFLKRATDLDPNLALAYWVLASASLNTGGGQDQRVVQGYAAKAQALRDRVSAVERFRIGPPAGNSDEALKNDELWAATYPRDSGPFALAGLIHAQRGELEESLRWQQQAYRLAPRSFNSFSLMNVYVGLDRIADAKAVAKEHFGLGLDNWQIHQSLLQIAWMEGDQEGAARQVAWFAGKPDEYRNLEYQAAHARMLGELELSRDLLQRAADLARRRGLNDVAARFLAPNVAGDALLGNCDSARRATPGFLQFSDRNTIPLALCGDATMAQQAERRVAEIASVRGSDSQWNNAELPLIRGAIEFGRGHPAIAIKQLTSVTPYERALTFSLYLRGLAFLRLKKGVEGAAEFQKIIDHKGASWGPMYPLSYLGLARAAELAGDTARSRHGYEDFLAMWKDADPGLPVLIQARTEYARLAR
jgi:DNA-binding winged helix-turn-helix (wHTH) protein/tetratricopeptide (TPR) repeat protein